MTNQVPANTDLAIGFDIGGTNMRGMAIDASGFRGDFVRRDRPNNADLMLDALAEMASEIQASLGRPAVGAGVGIAGMVDLSGTVRTSPNIPEIEQFALGPRLGDRLKMPVVVENDATAATWAEFVEGTGQDVDDIVFAGLGTGVGGGIVTNGRLVRGNAGLAGEIGHMILVPGGVPCPCGRNGCWERYASGSALGQQMADAVAAGRLDSRGLDTVRGTDLAQWAEAGEADAEVVLAEFAGWVALGIGNLVSALDPALIIVGGGLTDMGTTLLDAVATAYAKNMVDSHFRGETRIVSAQLADEAGVVGAALLALDGLSR